MIGRPRGGASIHSVNYLDIVTPKKKKQHEDFLNKKKIFCPADAALARYSVRKNRQDFINLCFLYRAIATIIFTT